MAKQVCRVENYQPVALRPIREVLGTTDVMWVGPMVHKGDKDGDSGNPVGWVKSGGNDEWIELEDSVTGLGYYNAASYLFFLDCNGVDLDRTMARALQPGERLVIEVG